MSNPLIAYLKLSKHVSEQDEAIIMANFEFKAYKEGDYLSDENKICNELFFISKGVLRIGSTNEKGVDITHYFYKENQLCTILQSFNEEIVMESGIQAACDAEVFGITKSKLLALYKLLPYIKELVDQVNQQQLLDKIRIRNTYIGEEAENQYKLFIKQQPEIVHRVPLKDIASYLGITPQSLSRIRKNIR